MAYAPTDLPTLDYEIEEKALLEAISGLEDVAFDSGDLGTFDELRDKVNFFRPHIVHLSGHGVAKGKEGWFAFENEIGQKDLKSSDDIRKRLAGQGVQCVFVSGCQTGQAPPVEALGGVCQGLVKKKVPMAIGWAASIADELAIKFARTLYRTLATAQTIDQALVQARQDVWESCNNQGNPSWTLPVLYASTTQSLIFDPNTQRIVEEPPRPNVVQQPLPGMSEGYAEYFVGRRREQQRFLPALRAGDTQILILTGLGGTGKSALATKLARKLEAEGFTLIPVPSSWDTPLNIARLLESCRNAFLQAAVEHRSKGKETAATQLEAASQILSNPQMAAKTRLHYVVTTLNSNRFLLVLDNFESNLNEQDRLILDQDLAEFYKHLLTNMAGNSRAIITTRYLPADLSTLPPKVNHEPLGDFGEAAFIKILRRDALVDMRYRSGEFSLELLIELYHTFGGTPRFMLQMREAIHDMKPDELRKQLASVDLPSDAQPGELQKIREDYFDNIFTSRLYSYLSPESQKALSRAAVYNVPVDLQGLEEVTGEPADRLAGFVSEWQDRAFLYSDKERGAGAGELWRVYGLLRGWLIDRLQDQDRKAAHKAAGDFLTELTQQNKEGSLGLNWVDCLQEARAQYLQAEEYEQARKVTYKISSFFTKQGLYAGVRRLNHEMLNYDQHPSMMGWIGRTYSDEGDYDAARKWYQQALDSSGNLLDEAASAWHGLALIDLKRGNYPKAIEKFNKSLQINQQIGNKSGEAYSWHNLASIDIEQGNYPEAIEKFNKSLQIHQQIGDKPGEAGSWHQLALIDLKQGNYPGAIEKFNKSLLIRQQIGDKYGEAGSWHGLALIDLKRGNYPKAIEKFNKSLQINQQIGNKSGEAYSWHNLASIDIEQGNYPEAIEKFNKSLQIHQQIGDKPGEAGSWHQLALIDLKQGNYPGAIEKFNKSLLIRQQIGDKYGEAGSWHGLASIDLNQGNYPEAIEKFNKSLLIRQQIGDKYGEAYSWHNLASIDLNQGNYPEAIEKFNKALLINQQIGDKYGEACTIYQLGQLAAEQGRLLEGTRLVALCYLIDLSIGHGDKEKDFQALSKMISILGHTEEQFRAMLRQVETSYERDRGKELIKNAFRK